MKFTSTKADRNAIKKKLADERKEDKKLEAYTRELDEVLESWRLASLKKQRVKSN